MKDSIKIAEELLGQGSRIVGLLDKFNLNWNVNKVNLIADDQPTQFFGTQREDTKEVFACVKKGYQVLQNWELAEIVTEVAGKFDMSVARGGLFQNGGKVFLQVHTGDLRNIGENRDTVKKYITAINSHDGSTSVGFGMSNVTVSCSNSFHAAYRSLNKIRHTMSMHEKIEVLTREFTRVREEEKTLYDTFFKLASAPASTDNIKKIVMASTAVDLNMKTEEARDVYTKYQLGQTKQLVGRIAEEMSQKGETLWGLFSGVTKYTNRDLRTPNRENGVIESKFTGGAGRMDNRAYQILSELVA